MEWRLYPLDVLFFRGMDPMNAGEHGAVAGLFPPSPEVMQGVVRTRAAEIAGGTPTERTAIADRLAEQIRLSGPYLVVDRGDGEIERWYPAPLDLWRTGDSGPWRPGTLGPAVLTDLGRVRLLTQQPGGAERWIRHSGLEAYLRGGEVAAQDVAHSAAFWELEERVGIGRDATTRATREGMLYNPAFVRLRWREDLRNGPQHTAARPAPDPARIGIGLRVEGLPANLNERDLAGLTRLGGEGRTAQLEIEPLPALPAGPVGDGAGRLVLLSPARWPQADGADGWLPPGFTAVAEGGATAWRHDGSTLVGAVAGKPQRIGGWDMKENRPKAARACLPAGSVYFFRGAAPERLADTADSGGRFGYGWAVTGRWQDTEGAKA